MVLVNHTRICRSLLLCKSKDPKSQSRAWSVFTICGPPAMAQGENWAGMSPTCGERVETLEKGSCLVLAPDTPALVPQPTTMQSAPIKAQVPLFPPRPSQAPEASAQAPASAGALGPRPPFLRAPPQTSQSLKTAPCLHLPMKFSLHSHRS